MAESFFRILLRLYPRQFRHRYGQEQLDFFRHEWTATASAVGRGGALLFWSKTVWDALGAALRLRFGSLLGRDPVPTPGDSGRDPEKRSKCSHSFWVSPSNRPPSIFSPPWTSNREIGRAHV